ncbi:MAG: hypothetical protein FJ313_01605, partial [Gemmatimonadetes bacterium]|nr:hypothetical protein [Gemmatimonadota bacterium]
QDVVAGLPKLASVSKLTKQTQAARAQDPVRQWIESMQWEDELVAGLEKARQERRAAPNGRVSVPNPSPGA